MFLQWIFAAIAMSSVAIHFVGGGVATVALSPHTLLHGIILWDHGELVQI